MNLTSDVYLQIITFFTSSPCFFVFHLLSALLFYRNDGKMSRGDVARQKLAGDVFPLKLLFFEVAPCQQPFAVVFTKFCLDVDKLLPWS